MSYPAVKVIDGLLCLTIRTNEPNFTFRYADNHNHLSLSDIEVKLFIREQELKYKKINCKRSTPSQRAELLELLKSLLEKYGSLYRNVEEPSL